MAFLERRLSLETKTVVCNFFPPFLLPPSLPSGANMALALLQSDSDNRDSVNRKSTASGKVSVGTETERRCSMRVNGKLCHRLPTCPDYPSSTVRTTSATTSKTC